MSDDRPDLTRPAVACGNGHSAVPMCFIQKRAGWFFSADKWIYQCTICWKKKSARWNAGGLFSDAGVVIEDYN